jgi:hypothetical protein
LKRPARSRVGLSFIPSPVFWQDPPGFTDLLNRGGLENAFPILAIFVTPKHFPALRLRLATLATLLFLNTASGRTLTDTIPQTTDSARAATPAPLDTVLRIINLNPFFSTHVDSLVEYDLEINKPQEKYYWYLRNAPMGLRLDRNSGVLRFKADKSFFKSGKLKYDVPYRVDFGVQSLSDPTDRKDTSLTLLIYDTEIIVSKLKPTVNAVQLFEEGDTVRFRVQCESGNFPIEQITMTSNISISGYNPVNRCNDEFVWMIPFDFIRDNDTARGKMLTLNFLGTDKFANKDTARLTLIIRPGINYPLKTKEHSMVSADLSKYMQDLKMAFYVVSRNIKANKKTRTGFDVTASTTALAGTILTTTANSDQMQDIGKILPSVGLTLVPVKEAVAPNKVQEQNTASQIRAAIKRLEYMQSECRLIGDRDPDILSKTKKMKDELNQARLQMVDLPMVEFENVTREEAESYFNNPNVNKKYKLKIN